jgi:hypothetical protein
MSKCIVNTLFLSLFSACLFSMDNVPTLQIGTPFMRLERQDEQTAVQCASKTYKMPSNNLKVTLLSGMHAARPDFYKRHTKIMDGATLVLFENKGADKQGLLWMSQPIVQRHEKLNFYVLIARAHNLAYQLESIDYHKAQFLLADYSFDKAIPNPEKHLKEIRELIEERSQTFSEKAAEQGYEDGFEYFVNLQIESAKKQPLKFIAAEIINASQNVEEFLKERCSPQQFEFEYTNRNKIVLDLFAQQEAVLNAVTDAHVVIYYGGAHMSYFEKQLVEKYGLTLEAEEWITALLY